MTLDLGIIPEQVALTAALLGPGFVALKVFYIFRAQPGRSQWEWTVWSVLAGLGLAWLVEWPATLLAARTGLGLDLVQIGARLLLAVVIGALLGRLWFAIMASPHPRADRLARRLTDSAWDRVFDNVATHSRHVVVDTTDDATFYGWVNVAGREDTRAHPFIYLTDVKEYNRATQDWGTRRVPRRAAAP